MAADEIERLRALANRYYVAVEDAIDTLEAMGIHVDNPLYERLRKAVDDAVSPNERAAYEQNVRPIKCEGCDTGIADPPSRLCPGCQAYVDHQR